jgi:4-amino-4-deoxy-L-arabinose transferase-like glycosyltransferase
MSPDFQSKMALAIALGLVLIMPSTESIWVDEAQTWRYARHNSIQEFCNEFINDHASETQMPLAMALAWAFGNILGTSEWMLRAPNILWAAGALLCFYSLGRKEKLPLLPLFLAIQPYLWFYVNEARPYALQIFGGSLLLLALHSLFTKGSKESGWVFLWGVGSIVTCGSSMLGAVPVACVSLAMLAHLVRNHHWPEKKQVWIFSALLAPLLALGIYYATTLLRGAGGSKIWQVGPQNLIFSAVEFVGVAGFLPPRQALREIARGTAPLPWDSPLFVANSVGALVFLALLLLFVFHGIRNWKTAPSWIIASTLVGLSSASLLFLAALFVGFPFWGRHLAACFPFFIVVVFWILAQFAKNQLSLSKFLPMIFCVALLCSSLILRFAPYHRKDDYRSAAKLAQSYLEQGKTVWWAADEPSLLYYLPELESHIASQSLFLAYGSRSTPIEFSKKPDLVLLSKPDIYDQLNSVSHFLNQQNYRKTGSFTAFSFYSIF